MPETATANVTLSAKIPDSSAFLSLLDSLKDKVAGVDTPSMPTDKIGKLVTSFKLELPDPSRWKSTVTADASRATGSLPDPASIIKPLAGPIATAKEIAATDFAGAISDLQERLRSLEAQAEADPKGFVTGMFTPGSPVADLVRDSPFLRLVIAIGRVLGVSDIEKVPENLLATAQWVQQLLQERIGGVIVAFAAAGQASTLVRRLVRASDALDAAVRVERLSTLRQATIDAYAAATASLRGLRAPDAAAEAAVTTSLLALRTAQQAYVRELTNILAFGEAAAVTIDLERANERFAQLGKSVASIKLDALGEVSSSAEALLNGILPKATSQGPTAADELDATMRRLLVELKSKVDEFDVSSIEQGIDSAIGTVTAPLDKLEKFKEDVEREVRGVLETIKDAIASVDLSPLRTEFDRSMGEVQSVTQQIAGEIGEVRGAIEGAIGQVTGALKEAHDFILNPETGLKAQIEKIFQQIHDILSQIDIQGTVGSVTEGVNKVTVELEKIELTPYIDATCMAIDVVAEIIDTVAPLLVTDDLRKKLSEATAVLREVDFDAIRVELQKVLDTIIEGVDAEVLGRISEEYKKVVAAIAKIDPTPALESLQAEVFDPLIAELEKIKPAEAMQPVNDVFAEARTTLSGFDPAASLDFLVEFHHTVSDQFEQVSPDKLLEPVQTALADLRKAITQSLRLHEIHDVLDKVESALAPILELADISMWFAQLDDGIVAMRHSIETFDPRALLGPLAGVLRDAFDRTGAVLDRHGLAALWEALVGSGEPLSAQLTKAATTIAGVRDRAASINVGTIITELRPLHQELRGAFTGASLSVGAKVELTGVVGQVDPMSAFATVQSRAPRAQAALVSLHADFTAMASKAAPVLGTSQQVIDALRVLRRPLEALWELVLTPLRSIMPIPQGAGVRAILLAAFDALDPRRWKTEIQQLAQSILAKLRVLTGGTVIVALKRALEKVMALVDGLNIDDLAAALREIHSAIAAQIEALNPEPLIASFRETYQSVVAALDVLDPGPMIAELDSAYREDVVGLVKAISPRDLLVEPLKKLFAEISAMLGVLDIGELFKPVLDELRRLRTELLDGIERAGVSYEGLIASIPTSGGGEASVSASVSVG